MTREEIIEQGDFSILEALHIDINDVPDELLFRMAQPWDALSKEDQLEILMFLQTHAKNN